MQALPRTEDGFEEWLRVPMKGSDDPYHEIRRASELDFDAIHDLVDEVFGFKRPRARSEWLYRQNPLGRARCFVGVEKATGSLVAARVWWPWPLARGDEPIVAALGGDWVVSPRSQRQGVGKLLRGGGGCTRIRRGYSQGLMPGCRKEDHQEGKVHFPDATLFLGVPCLMSQHLVP